MPPNSWLTTGLLGAIHVAKAKTLRNWARKPGMKYHTNEMAVMMANHLYRGMPPPMMDRSGFGGCSYMAFMSTTDTRLPGQIMDAG